MSRYLLRVMRGGCEVQYRDESGSFILSQLKQMWQRFERLEEASEPIPEDVKPCGMPHSFWLQRGSFVAEVASDTDVKFIQSVMSLWCHALIEGQWPGATPAPAAIEEPAAIETEVETPEIEVPIAEAIEEPEAVVAEVAEEVAEPAAVADEPVAEVAIEEAAIAIEIPEATAEPEAAVELIAEEPAEPAAEVELAVVAEEPVQAEAPAAEVELPLKPSKNPLSAIAAQ